MCSLLRRSMHQPLRAGLAGPLPDSGVLEQGLLSCRDCYAMDAVYVHDPCALAAVLRPSLFSWQAGQVQGLLPASPLR